MATIKEIKEKLALIRQLDDPFFAEMEKDGRTGVTKRLQSEKGKSKNV